MRSDASFGMVDVDECSDFASSSRSDDSDLMRGDCEAGLSEGDDG